MRRAAVSLVLAVALAGAAPPASGRPLPGAPKCSIFPRTSHWNMQGRPIGIAWAAWFVSGAPSRGWDNDDLHSLGRERGSDFEVVDTSRLPRPGR